VSLLVAEGVLVILPTMATEVRMSQQVVSLIQAMSGVASVTTAVIALVIALRVDARASTRFRTQLDLTQKLAIANIKPVLGLVTAEFSNLKSIQLVNYGTGTAVVGSNAMLRTCFRLRCRSPGITTGPSRTMCFTCAQGSH
jgi:hypothetical protein